MSSFSSIGVQRVEASRTITWHVVHAQTFSQACSISMPWSSRLSQIERPVTRFELGGPAERQSAMRHTRIRAHGGHASSRM
jgi:hypothetical protein